MKNWHLTLPTKKGILGHNLTPADEIDTPELLTYTGTYFHMNAEHDGVVFTAPVDGARTSGNTNYPRSELRERTDNGKNLASWSSSDGILHKMVLTESVTHLPFVKPQHVFCQIHGTSGVSQNPSDIIECLATQKSDGSVTLSIRNDTGQASSSPTDLLDDHYVLGTSFKITLEVLNDVIQVTYQKGSVSMLWSAPIQDDGLYFKAGAYVQSNPTYDAIAAYGETVIFDLSATHTSP